MEMNVGIPIKKKSNSKKRANTKLNTKELTDEEKYLKQALDAAMDEIEIAYNNFENVTDPCLIDHYIYKIKSLQLKYKYLLEKWKKEISERS